ncbi:MAG TPA: hypothetical protein VFZ73_15055 [Gemmatimonadaceae bacterium]
MPTAQRVEGTGSRYAGQGRRRALGVALALGCGVVPCAGKAQLPFTVSIVDWHPEALKRQRRLYRAVPPGHEVLFCVESWTTEGPKDGFQRIIISRTRKEDTGDRHQIDQTALKCRDQAGASLPTIHTHSEGNCQPSPTDMLMIAARGALFDGIQCGEHHVVWVFAWQIKAIGNSVMASQRPP